MVEGRLLVEGWRSIEAVLNSGADIDWLLVAEDADDDGLPQGLMDRLVSCARRTDRIPPSQLKAISFSVTPSGLAALVAWAPMSTHDLLAAVSTSPGQTANQDGSHHLVVVTDGISEPGNLGTIIRTADWFGATAVFAGTGSVELTNPKVVQATMGSLFQLPIGSGDSTVDFLRGLKALGFYLVSFELGGELDVRNVAWPEKLALVVGNEARGVSAEVSALADQRVMIPRFGRAESLNAAATIAVILGQIALR
jgi:TrmH family RNA methyltransferase